MFPSLSDDVRNYYRKKSKPLTKKVLAVKINIRLLEEGLSLMEIIEREMLGKDWRLIDLVANLEIKK